MHETLCTSIATVDISRILLYLYWSFNFMFYQRYKIKLIDIALLVNYNYYLCCSSQYIGDVYMGEYSEHSNVCARIDLHYHGMDFILS